MSDGVLGRDQDCLTQTTCEFDYFAFVRGEGGKIVFPQIMCERARCKNFFFSPAEPTFCFGHYGNPIPWPLPAQHRSDHYRGIPSPRPVSFLLGFPSVCERFLDRFSGETLFGALRELEATCQTVTDFSPPWEEHVATNFCGGPPHLEDYPARRVPAFVAHRSTPDRSSRLFPTPVPAHLSPSESSTLSPLGIRGE